MDFGLLGPLTVRADAGEIRVPPGMQRTVLAVLLLNANQVVPIDELAHILWGASPPPTAEVTVRNYIKRLRHALGDADQTRIRTVLRGYLIAVGADELDVFRFDALLASGRAAARDGAWNVAAEQARAALALCRDTPLADVASEALALNEIPHLAEKRLQAVELRIDADIRLGRQADVIGELRRLVAAEPLREGLHGLLMLALYLDGRQGDALSAYRQARQVLVDELGAEPGHALRELQGRILAADPALLAPGPWQSARSAAPPVPAPRQLPAAVRQFRGRREELAALNQLLDDAGAGTIVISAIDGTAGVGKTALAVQWAHQAAHRFADGQLYVNLRGYDLDQPMSPGEALAGFLRALGMPGQDLPADIDGRAAMYRSLLAGRRALVLLDNASDAEQVRPLVPGSPTCATVVTSRDSLAGLVALDGAMRLDLDVLPAGDAVDLLRALIGSRAVDDSQACETLASQCCRLPLALRIASELAVARPGVSLADLVEELADHRRRLDTLDVGGDPRAAVRTVLSWSYRHLEPSAARAFRLLGVYPGPDFDAHAVAALADIAPGPARDLLDALTGAHLIQPVDRGRFAMHDLLRAYARELAAQASCQDEIMMAQTRLFDYYLGAAAVAMDSAFPSERHRRPAVARPATPVARLADQARAREWLNAELPSLVAAAAAARDRWPNHVTGLAQTLFRFLETSGYHTEAAIIHGHARHAASLAGDLSGEADALAYLAIGDAQEGRCEHAVDQLQQALALYRKGTNRIGEARVLSNLSVISERLGRRRQAIGHNLEAIALFRVIGDRTGEARATGNLGLIRERQGDYQEAADHYARALVMFREDGDLVGQGYIHTNLGGLRLRQGRIKDAADEQCAALKLFRDCDSRYGEASALSRLGRAYQELGRSDEAIEHHERALALFREAGDRSGEAEGLNDLSQTLLAAGQPERARAEHAAALELAERIGDLYQQARGHDGLAHCYHLSAEADLARQHWQQALDRYTTFDAPEAAQIRARLRALGVEPGGASMPPATADAQATGQGPPSPRP
jgi:DNA-binding SARP family transcriptional activator/tetratricopeptide (TPR) repeat protein